MNASALSRSRNDVVLACAGIERSFGGLKALKGIDFDIREGEIFGLVGPNGSGKTTMVNVITGFYRPQAGTVRLFGRDITYAPRAELTLQLCDKGERFRS